MLTLFLASSCGVKNNPVNPDNTSMPSILEHYPDIKVDQPLNETKKKR